MLTAAASLIVVLVAAPGPTLPEALAKARKGEPVGKLDPKIGKDCVARIHPGLDEAELEAHIAVARAGGADKPLAAALVRLVDRGSPLAAKAGAALNLLPAPVRQQALREVGALGLEGLLTEAETPPPLRDLAAGLLVEALDAELLTSRLVGWSGEATAVPAVLSVLKACPRHQRPAELLEALVNGAFEGDQVLAALRASTYAMALASPQAFEAAQRRASMGDFGTGAAVMRCLGAASLPQYDAAAAAIADVLGAAEGDPKGTQPHLLAATIESASELLVPELVPLIGKLTADGLDLEVRMQAIKACGRVCYRDRPTLTMLIKLLHDMDERIRLAAWEVLKAKSGQKFPPADHRAWEEWLSRSNLPDEPPITDTVARLAEERKIRLASRKR